MDAPLAQTRGPTSPKLFATKWPLLTTAPLVLRTATVTTAHIVDASTGGVRTAPFLPRTPSFVAVVQEAVALKPLSTVRLEREGAPKASAATATAGVVATLGATPPKGPPSSSITRS